MTTPPETLKEICICAAIKLADGRVIRCHRHHDGLRIIGDWNQQATQVDSPFPRIDHRKAEQGFMTSANRFVGREEGLRLQLAAGIESKGSGYRGSQLYSEDLY